MPQPCSGAACQQQLRVANNQWAGMSCSKSMLTLLHIRVFIGVQAVSAKDALIAQLQQQLEQQASSIAASTGDHENNMTQLIKSINEMQQSCQAQVRVKLAYGE